MQTFSNILARRIESMGGEVRTGCAAAGVQSSGGAVEGVRTEDGELLKADEVYWSAPISKLYPEAGLEFINTVIYCIGLSKPQSNGYQWCYFGSEDISFSRTTVPSNFSESAVPDGRDSITVEMTCSKSDAVWRDPESRRSEVLADLERVGALDRRDVLFVRPLRICQTYPVYDLEYRRRLEEISPPRGLHLMGRCGSFWYNNMDHSIAQALAMAEGGEMRRDFWKEP